MKQKLSLICALALILCSIAFPAHAAESTELDLTQEVAEALIDLAGFETQENAIISMTDEYVSVAQTNASGELEITHISSYAEKEDEDGYAPINPNQLTDEIEAEITSNPKARSSTQQTISFKTSSSVSFSVSVTVIYSRYTNTIGTSIYYFYRPYGVQASWTSSSSISVSYLRADYDTVGELVPFIDCIQTTSYSALSSSVISNDYRHTVSLTQSNPVKGTAYIKYNYMASDRALWLANYIDVSSITVWITVGGVSYTDGCSLGQTY